LVETAKCSQFTNLFSKPLQLHVLEFTTYIQSYEPAACLL